MQRWAIALDGDTRRRLTEEQLELGTELHDLDGRKLLVFRDRFVCLRVARAAGTEVMQYQEPETAPAA
ncbi:MAG TPA: hypothetical protein VF168_03090 [Trueperaceae bacterium]